MKMTVIKLLWMIYYFITEFESKNKMKNICKGYANRRKIFPVPKSCTRVTGTKDYESWDTTQTLVKIDKIRVFICIPDLLNILNVIFQNITSPDLGPD